MSGSVNSVILVGHLGADPEVRSFPQGGKVANFSIATTDSWKDGSGEKRERTTWSRIAVLNDALAEICGNYLKKGSRVAVQGALENREYTKDGVKHTVTEVVLRPYKGDVTMLDSPSKPETKGRGGRTEPRP